jgi:hypothetical protein
MLTTTRSRPSPSCAFCPGRPWRAAPGDARRPAPDGHPWAAPHQRRRCRPPVPPQRRGGPSRLSNPPITNRGISPGLPVTMSGQAPECGPGPRGLPGALPTGPATWNEKGRSLSPRPLRRFSLVPRPGDSRPWPWPPPDDNTAAAGCAGGRAMRRPTCSGPSGSVPANGNRAEAGGAAGCAP